LTEERDADDQELQRLREWLHLGVSGSESEPDLITLEGESPDSDLDAGLRQLGFNRPEREELRRGPRPLKRNYDNVNLKRYIRERASDSASELDIGQLALEWAELTGYDVDLAKRFWDAGFDPVDLGQFAAFIKEGFGLRELEEAEVQGKTVAQHLREKQSVRWCINALWSLIHKGGWAVWSNRGPGPLRKIRCTHIHRFACELPGGIDIATVPALGSCVCETKNRGRNRWTTRFSQGWALGNSSC